MVKFGKMNGFQFESFCSIWFIFPHLNFKTIYGHAFYEKLFLGFDWIQKIIYITLKMKMSSYPLNLKHCGGKVPWVRPYR